MLRSHGEDQKGILLGDWWCKGMRLLVKDTSKTYQLKHEEVNHAAGEFVCLKDEDQSQLWVCTQVVSIARGRKSKISFHRAFITERKARSTKIWWPMCGNGNGAQSTAGTACCERLPSNWKASEALSVKSEVDRQSVPKLWWNAICSKKHADFG